MLYVALVVAVLALLVAIAAFIRATAMMDNTDVKFRRVQELLNQHREADSRLNTKIDRGQASLRRSLSDFRGEVRRALAEPEPQEEVRAADAEPAPEEAKPRRRKRRARLNLFERIAADESTIPDEEDESK